MQSGQTYKIDGLFHPQPQLIPESRTKLKNGQHISINESSSFNLSGLNIQEEKKNIEKNFESPILEGLYKDSDKFIETHTEQKNQKSLTQNKFLGQRNDQRNQIFFLEQQVQKLKEKLENNKGQLANLKQLKQKENENNRQTIKNLKAGLYQTNNKIKDLQDKILEKDKKIFQERVTLHDKITSFLVEQDDRKIKQPTKIKELKFEDIWAKVEQLGFQLKNKIRVHEQKINYVQKDFDEIIFRLEQAKMENFTYSKDGFIKVSLFGDSIEELKNRFNSRNQFILPSYYEKLIDLMKKVDDKNIVILSDWNGKLTSAYKKIEQLEVESNRIKKQLEQKVSQNTTLQNDLNNTKQQLKGEITKLQKEKNTLKVKLEQLTSEIESQKINISDLRNHSSIQINKINKQLQIKQRQLLKASQQISTLNKTINQLEKSNNIHTNQNQNFKAAIDKLNNQVSQLNKKINDLKAQLENATSTGKASQNQARVTILQNQKQITQLKKEISKAIKLNQEQQGKIQEVQTKLTTTNKQLRDKQKQNYELKQIQKEMENHITELQMKPKFIRCYEQYFNGKILNYQNPKQTELFVGHIEAQMGRSIISTRLLYRDDRYNTNSYHNYVDGVPNIVLLVTHSGGQIIGSFSEAAYHSKNFNCDFKKGLMLEFTNGRVFHTKQKKENGKGNKMISRPLSYDEFYIIWGNSDLRIKPPTPQARDTDLELHSFYGTANSCYEEKGNPNSSIEELFGTKNRNLTFEGFQMFEVIFE